MFRMFRIGLFVRCGNGGDLEDLGGLWDAGMVVEDFVTN
jgi:hypothetical protein